MSTPANDVENGGQDAADRAWVVVDTPLPVGALLAFLQDVERLYRINPLLEIDAFDILGAGRYRLRARNLSNSRDLDTELAVTHRSDGLDVRYNCGLKTMTTFRALATAAGSRLVVTDVYAGAREAERQARLAEVDLSLNAWGRGLHTFLGQWSRWHKLTPWRCYMAKVWQPMRPSARRIVFLILAISAFEVVTMAIVFLVWLAAR